MSVYSRKEQLIFIFLRAVPLTGSRFLLSAWCFVSKKGLCMSAAHLGFPTETVVVFVVMAVGAMFIDLFMHRHDKPVSLKSAAMWSIFWVMMAMAFAGFLYVHHGAEMASLFLTGYALEEVLSITCL